MASNRILSTDEVVRGFHSLLDKAIKHVKANQALSAGWTGTEPEVNKYGPALCLYYSACRSDTAAPGVRLPTDGQTFKLLWVSTCPRKFILFFHRWAHVVPLIKSLTTDHKIDLERLLCDKLPISLPPVPSSHFPWAISAEESALNHVRSISDELHSLASDITRLPCFQYRYNPPPPLTLCNELFTSYSTSPTSPTEMIAVMISSQMSAAEIIAHLGRHGCRNLTHDLDTTSFSNGPVNRGGVGEIHRGRLNDGRRVAIKTIFLRTDEDECDRKYLKHAAQELHTWSKCRHRNVVPLLGVAEFRGQIAMLSPWMENGTLRDYVNRKPSADRCALSTQVAQGLAYLHSIGIVHGDLKGANVLVSFDGIAALTDFDNAVLGDTTLQFTRTRAKEKMSIRWTAPEILTGEGECSPEADVYALGMTILETLTGKVPFSRKNDIAVMFFVGVRKEIPERPKEHISPSGAQGNRLWSMLVNCWWHVPQGRPSAELVYETMKAINPEGIVSRPEI